MTRVYTSVLHDPGGDLPAVQTYTVLPQAESTVNGVNYKEKSLAPCEPRSFSVAVAMQPGSNNTIEVSAKGGKKGASAGVFISD